MAAQPTLQRRYGHGKKPESYEAIQEIKTSGLLRFACNMAYSAARKPLSLVSKPENAFDQSIKTGLRMLSGAARFWYGFIENNA